MKRMQFALLRRLPLLALAGALLALPLAGAAQSPITFHVVLNWPVKKGKKAPKYHKAEVSAVTVRPATGEVYVFQRAPYPMLVFDRNGNYLRAWGRKMFLTPHGARFDPEGDLWVTDLDLQQVMKLTPDGKVLQAWGTRGVPGNDQTHFNQPTDIAFGLNGDVYISDGYGNNRVVHLARDGSWLGSWGTPGKGPGQFNLPHSISTDANGRVYVADRGNGRIQVFTPDGQYVQQIPPSGNMGYVNGVYVTADQRLLIAEGINNLIYIYDLTGNYLGSWGGRGSAPGHFFGPHLLCTDDQGCVYVAEINGRRVQKFAPN